MLNGLFYILFWIINYRLRGHDFYDPRRDFDGSFDTNIRKTLDIFTGKTPLAILMLVVTWYLYGFWPALIVGVGYRLEVMLGQGLYFISFSGDLESFFKRDYNNVLIRKAGKVTLDNEIRFIERLADKISSLKFVNNNDIRRKLKHLFDTGGIPSDRLTEYKAAANKWGLIAMIIRAAFILVIFIALSFLFKTPLPLLAGLGVALAQGFTYYGFRKYYTAFLKKWQSWIDSSKKGKEPKNKTIGYIELFCGFYRGLAYSLVLILSG